MKRLRLLLVLPLFFAGTLARADMRLVMVEETGCVWCARWNAEIAPIYTKTPEGQQAPLYRIDINQPLPTDLIFSKSMHYTPTFVLLQDGKELSRIEGYPGEDFFWGLLGKMISQAEQEQTPE